MKRFIVYALFAVFSLTAFAQKTANVEIKDYQGQKLGSVKDFRENSIKGVQKIDIGKYRLEVLGLVDKKQSLTYQEVLAMPHAQKLITLQCVEGWEVKALWDGIPLSELFKRAGVKAGATNVIFRSSDGYSTSLPLKTILERNIILADKINGLVLPPAQGYPFILAAEDKWGYKWARWVVSIELSSDDSFKGFWEKSGYSNNGDVSGPQVETQR
jgi:DMSO/TMAO reductase YedYZ molybdopterin-dependent catalytic subunit